MYSCLFQFQSLGINDPLSFEFLDNPSQELITKALVELFHLGAIDDDGKITELGQVMCLFPLEPFLAKLLICAVHYGCREEMLTIAAMVSIALSANKHFHHHYKIQSHLQVWRLLFLFDFRLFFVMYRIVSCRVGILN